MKIKLIGLLIFFSSLIAGVNTVRGSEVWSWGRNDYGQLGNNDDLDTCLPVQAHIPADNFVAISGGKTHTLALRSDGTVWAWGDNYYGQLGIGNYVEQWEPCSTYISDVIAIACDGWYHSHAVKSDGTVWSWGRNLRGALGNGSDWATTPDTFLPCSTYISDVVAIASGWHFVLALKSDSTVWAWGSNLYGEMGIGTSGNDQYEPCSTHIENVVAIAAGYGHSLVLKSDSTVWAFGLNSYGQLGDNTNVNKTEPCSTHISDVIAIAAANRHSLALKSDSTVWAWGNNCEGQLGDGTHIDRWEPCSTQIAKVVAIATGGDERSGSFKGHSLALKSDSTVWAWGYNAFGELGNGDWFDEDLPCSTWISGVTSIASGMWHSLAIGEIPTNITIISFNTSGYNGYVSIEWETASEKNICGFNIARSIHCDSGFSQINKLLIRGKGNSVNGAHYSYIDSLVTNGITYWYRLNAVDSHGKIVLFAADSATPHSYLYGNLELEVYPNPFTTKTTIRWVLGTGHSASGENPMTNDQCQITISIYDVSGRLVKQFTIHDLRFTDVTWDGRDDNGKLLPSGIYYCKLTQGNFTQTRKILFVK